MKTRATAVTATSAADSQPKPSASASESTKAPDDAQTLQILLANTSDAELAKHLSAAPAACTPAQLKALLSVLKTLGMDVASARALASAPSTASASKRLHCVRCHSKYTEKENGLKACVITHEDMDPGQEFMGGRPHEYKYTCYGCGHWVYDDDTWPKVCFQGKHTTKPEEVNYGTTTEECEDRGCLRKKKRRGVLRGTGSS